MSHQHCAVPHCCKSGYRIENGKKVTFHRFPRDSELKKQWLIKIKRDESESFQVKRHTTVCSLHFKESDFEVHGYSGRRTLLPGTVPSVFDCWKNILHAYKTPKERRPNRLKEQRERQAHLRKFESPQARSQRLKAQRERQALLRQTESPQAKSQRLKEQRERQARLRLKKQREIQADLRQSNSVDFIISHPDTTGMISLRNSVHQLPCLGDKSEKYTADIMDPCLSNSTCDFNEIGIKEEMFEHHTHLIQPTVNQKHVNIKQEVDTNQTITGPGVDMNHYMSIVKIPLIKHEQPGNAHGSHTEEHEHTDLVDEHMLETDFKQTGHLHEVKTEDISPMRTGDSSHVISNNISYIKTAVISENEHEMSAYANTEITS